MEHISFSSKVVNVEGDDGRTVTGISAVIGVMDSGLDLLHKGAFVKTISERGDRVKHLWQHDMHQPPIATIVELKEVGRADLPKDMKEKWPSAKGGLLVKRKYLPTVRGEEVLAGLKSDPPAVTEMSFGYDAVKFDFEEVQDGDYKGMLFRNLREVRLWDTSDVNWGMNEATVAHMKSALPFKDTGKSDMESDWSKPSLGDFTDQAFDEDMSEGEKRRIAAHFAWTANNPPDSFADLKLPHHMAGKEGVGPAVWKGVTAAMGRLMQEGTQIPDGDRKAVYNHLSKHYEQFDKTPPDFKAMELMWSVKNGLALLEPANVATLSGVSFDVFKVYDQLKELDELLRAEPKPAASPAAILTQQKLVHELLIRKRVLALQTV